MPPDYPATKAALLSGAISLHYQRIHCLRSGELRGYEALARWDQLSPPDIAAIVESHSLQALWIRCQVAQINRVLALLPPQIWISLNLDQSALALPQLPTLLSTPRPQRLHVEVLESVHLRERGAIEMLRELRAAKYLIFADDIGEEAGLSRFLQKGIWQGIKLDKELTQGLPDDRQIAVITESILELAARLNLESVAEWVERIEQAQWLRANGCNMGQGRLFGMPGPLG